MEKHSRWYTLLRKFNIRKIRNGTSIKKIGEPDRLFRWGFRLWHTHLWMFWNPNLSERFCSYNTEYGILEWWSHIIYPFFQVDSSWWWLILDFWCDVFGYEICGINRQQKTVVKLFCKVWCEGGSLYFIGSGLPCLVYR